MKVSQEDKQKMVIARQQGYNQIAIAKAFGITQPHVSRILKELGYDGTTTKSNLDITTL